MGALESANIFLPLRESKVLIVDDDPMMHIILTDLLADLVEVHSETSSDRVLSVVDSYQPDLVLLDINMPDIDGLTLCNILKTERSSSDIPVVFITSIETETQENLCWQAGASDYIRKPFNKLTILHRIFNQLLIKQQRDLLAQQAVLDPLTGLKNRRYMDEQLPIEFARAERHDWPVSVLMVDVDHFKLYNDHYGHPAGDRCLQFVTREINKVLRRSSDWAVRYGGEEFLLVFPEADLHAVKAMAELLLFCIQEAARPHDPSALGIVTVSIGAAQWTPSTNTSRLLIDEADKNLYLAKQQGRNQVVMAVET